MVMGVVGHACNSLDNDKVSKDLITLPMDLQDLTSLLHYVKFRLPDHIKD